MSFADKERPRKPSSIKIIESENDFPFAHVTSLRIGSAHAVSPDTIKDEHLRGLLLKLVAVLNSPDAVAEVRFEFKTPSRQP